MPRMLQQRHEAVRFWHLERFFLSHVLSSQDKYVLIELSQSKLTLYDYILTWLCTSPFTLLVPHLLHYSYLTFYTTRNSPFTLLVPHFLHYLYLTFDNSEGLAESKAQYIPNSLLKSFSQRVLTCLAALANTPLPHNVYSSVKHTKIIQWSHCIVFFLILRVQVSPCSYRLGTRI